jgi:hypothetical protein
MAHFAQLDDNNKVTQVVVLANEFITDESGNEVEALGVGFLAGLIGGVWKQTSYHANFRGVYAGIGFTYDADLDEFVAPPQPDPVEDAPQ